MDACNLINGFCCDCRYIDCLCFIFNVSMYSDKLVLITDFLKHYDCLSCKCTSVKDKIYINTSVCCLWCDLGFSCNFISISILYCLSCGFVHCCSCYFVCLARNKVCILYSIFDMDICLCECKLGFCLCICCCCLD